MYCSVVGLYLPSTGFTLGIKCLYVECHVAKKLKITFSQRYCSGTYGKLIAQAKACLLPAILCQKFYKVTKNSLFLSTYFWVIRYLCNFVNQTVCYTLFTLLFILFSVALGVQLFFILFVYAKLIPVPTFTQMPASLPTVSVIVCSWNEHLHLLELLPLLDQQAYPTFEVIVVDDRSTDGTYDFLLTEAKALPNVRFIRIEETPEHLSPKKYALTLGIKSARHEVLLLTDADCRPQSNEWIHDMAVELSDDKDIVLGFSPYFVSKSLLNQLIGYETLITATNYLSFALYGMPYMGVGRNLMYRKKLFFEHKGFASHTNVLGGDDDLFINEVATAQNTAICLNPSTFVYSFPKRDWKAWFWQKKRHLSVSQYYKPESKLSLGILSGSQLLFWLLALVLLPLVWGSTLQYVLLGLWLLRLTAHWVVLGKINKRLNQTIAPLTIPWWDVCLTLYYAIMGLQQLLPKRQKMRWR